jgi:4-amino-4-deoxy-L-arabinose transferase-like glycosyltransferase
VIRCLLLGILALSIRLAFVEEFFACPLFDANSVPGTDMEFLVGWARRIAGGDVLGRGSGPFWWAPLYPYTLAALFAALGPSLHAAALAQAALGAATCVLVYLLGRELCGEAAGLIAGVLAAVYGPSIFYAGVFLSTTLEVVLCVAALLALTLARVRPTGARWTGAGLVMGLTCLARPNFLLATGLVALLVPVLAGGEAAGARRRPLRLGGAFVLGALLVIAPVTLRNFSVGGRLVLISAAGPETFRIANSYDSTPLNFVYPKAPRMPVTSAAFWQHQARKAVLFWSGFEPPQNVNYYLARQLSPVLGLPWLPFWLAVPLAALGLWASRRRWRACLHFYVVLGAYYLSVVAFFVIARWRLPLVLPLLVFAGAGVEALAQWVRARRWQTAAAGAAAVTALAWLAFPGHGPFLFPADHGQLGYILANRGAYAEAAHHLALALPGFPDNGALHRDLGALLLRAGRLGEARPLLERAVALLPDDARAHHQLGKLLALSRAAPERARAQLQRALSLGVPAPVDAEIRGLLATLGWPPPAP